MISTNEIETLLTRGDATVVASDGAKIGDVGEFYVDDTTRLPEWVTVKTGLFGTKQSFVPLAEASVVGDEVRVPYDKSRVKDAPRVDQDERLSEEEEAQLYAHYGLPYSTQASPSGLPAAAGTAAGTTPRTAGRGAATTAGTDDAMVRSEERLRVGTERVETGRARLRKFVVTEHQSVGVAVAHDEVRVIREPVTGEPGSAAPMGEQVAEVTLTAERPVVEKDVVPVERIRLGTERVVDTETVAADVRKEEVELIDPKGTRTDVDSDPRA